MIPPHFTCQDPEEGVKAEERRAGPVDEEAEKIWRQMEEVTEGSDKVKSKVVTRSAVKRKAPVEA